jgi:6-phosphogluconolactonase (cycloisomerase 2 family)
MKFRKFGQVCLALVVSLGLGFGVTSCSTDHTVGYFYVTGTQYQQISGFRIDNNLGQLTATENSPYSSGGINPTKILVTTAGKFVYVLNTGCGTTGQIPCPANTPADQTGANISLFTVGGQGGLSFQASYTSQGNQPIAIQADASGTHLFVLDSTVPDPTTCVGYVGTAASICGDITAFNIDGNTGRLSLITNQQVKNSAGTNLTYFPIGSSPINFFLIPSGSFIYTIEKGQSGSAVDPPQAVFVYANTNGQLTLTQNTPIITNAIQLSYIYASSRYVYLIDAENGANAGQILPYTVGTNGALQSLVHGQVNNTGTVANPGPMIVDHQGKFLYLTNMGPNLTPSSEASSVSAFFIDQTNGELTQISTTVPFGAGASPVCILEDPSNQYLYTANYGSSQVVGSIINSATGTLQTLRKATTFATTGQPTWCTATGTLF